MTQASPQKTSDRRRTEESGNPSLQKQFGVYIREPVSGAVQLGNWKKSSRPPEPDRRKGAIGAIMGKLRTEGETEALPRAKPNRLFAFLSAKVEAIKARLDTLDGRA